METILIAEADLEKIVLIFSLVIIFGGAIYAIFAPSKKGDKSAD